MSVTRENLALLAQFRRGRINPPRWVLDNGRDFEFSPLPKGVRLCKQGQCYYNAMRLVWKDEDRYVYVEGFATATGSSLTTLYAWCYDRQTGRIIDKTWKNGGDYVGVPIRMKYAREFMLKYGYHGSMIDDWSGGYPLITGAIPREVWEEHL